MPVGGLIVIAIVIAVACGKLDVLLQWAFTIAVIAGIVALAGALLGAIVAGISAILPGLLGLAVIYFLCRGKDE